MKTSMKNVSKALAAALLTTSAGFAHAATATANLSVTATITSSCTISAPTAVAFGNYDPVSGVNSTTAGAVSVACAKSSIATLWIGLSDGANPVTGQRNMLGGTGGADKLAYNLMQPASGAVGAACPAYGAGTAWTNLQAGGLTITAPPGKAARSFSVCGQIAAGQDVSVGSYTDTVVATINF